MTLGRGLSSLIPPKRDISQESGIKNPEGEVEEKIIADKHGGDFTLSESPIQNENNKKTADDNLLTSDVNRFTPLQPALPRKTAPSKESIFLIEVDKISPNPHQPRRDFDEESLKELAQSIREFGILQPLIVSKLEKETDFGSAVEYQLIAGERRLMAAKMLGWERVPSIIKSNLKKSEHLEMAIVENLQRSNLNSIETARAYAKLQDEFGITQREIGSRLGKSRETIANTLRLLNLPTQIQDAVAKGQINESQARLLLIVSDPSEQQNLFENILSQNLSVREIKRQINKTTQQLAADSLQLTTDIAEMRELQERLTELLGAKVKIVLQSDSGQEQQGGKIVISFHSPEEIEGIIEKLNPKS